MRALKTLIVSAMLLGSVLAGGACDSVDAAFDCDAVCTRYRDCYKSDYDVGACRSRCRTNSANDPTVRSKANACEACIGDMSCISATFNCGQDCGAIVP